MIAGWRVFRRIGWGIYNSRTVLALWTCWNQHFTLLGGQEFGPYRMWGYQTLCIAWAHDNWGFVICGIGKIDPSTKRYMPVAALLNIGSDGICILGLWLYRPQQEAHDDPR